MENPLVSVIIPAFNAADFIEETLDSILGQTYRNLEVIVVDDGSTDSTAAIVQAYAPRIQYIHQENSGSCAAPRNHGLKKAKGSLVTFFDADDIMLPHKITSQVEALNRAPQAVMSITNYRNFSDAGRSADHFSTCARLINHLESTGGDNVLVPSLTCRDILIDENFTIASAPLYRSDALRALGGFDESLKACEDFHLIYRAALMGDVVVSRTVGFERRLHDLNMSGDNERMLINLISSRLKLIECEPIENLKARLEARVQGYRRKLQACLVNKGQLKNALKLYSQTFPPTSSENLKHDVRQGVKILLNSAKLATNSNKQVP